MPAALVTGGCGFIGSNFLNIIKERHPDIEFVNIDKLDYCSNIHNVNSGVAKFIQHNLCNVGILENIVKEYKFDYVFHFAAQSHVDNSFTSPLGFTLDNTYGTHTLVEVCRRHIPNVEFIHFSTDEVYGESKTDEPFTEDTGVLRPTNPYSASKAAAEMIVRSYIESFDMNIKIIRCNNVYGPNQYPEKLIPKFIRLLKEGKKCTIHGINSANVRRAFMHVHDVVDAVEVVWKSGKPGEVYNIASDDELSVMDVTKLIIKTLKNTEEYDEWIECVEDRPFNDQRYYICAKKLKELGWSQKRTREDLVKYIQD
ncbi:NAD dependent epimerase/dehydratase [Ostreococcus lucimarinus virus OlV6]|jgi:dTDP-glucose 4,6-dehydratase|uniref:nucleotide-sugar epimerase n=1 Tax=Ostreococcus tauri virus 2 TaxID=696472 RepID=UPI0001EF47F5|nr:nucleotide-sugar epimerase [Ostreococcus tauri virus 2]YP_007674860.1 nucleotide-sugar epimerase [Ostreococcus lucimarinus virus OlV5]AFK65970.1 NAD dependent epimerase/dehydratase [Ostreococcus lucimarinus virus OlV6]AGH31291.1 dTDP-glucose 4,6-dehydratase [Ostreococcus lucimarinus virus OlV5]CBI70032.1 putative TDP-glucose 4,6-dehydratase [Ostreococcus tauri virus 2]